MKKVFSIRPKFVNEIPESLVEGILYISLPYQTAAHACCCGCKTRVDTPLIPTGWNLIQKERSVSLEPSIGNTYFSCLSHYWIRDNQVVWAPPFSKYEAARVRLRNRIDSDAYWKYDSNPPASFRLLSKLRMFWLRVTWSWRR